MSAPEDREYREDSTAFWKREAARAEEEGERIAAQAAAAQAMRQRCRRFASDAIPTANPPRGDGYGDHVAGERMAAERILRRINDEPIPNATALTAALAKARAEGVAATWNEAARLAKQRTTTEAEHSQNYEPAWLVHGLGLAKLFYSRAAAAADAAKAGGA